MVQDIYLKLVFFKIAPLVFLLKNRGLVACSLSRKFVEKVKYHVFYLKSSNNFEALRLQLCIVIHYRDSPRCKQIFCYMELAGNIAHWIAQIQSQSTQF